MTKTSEMVKEKVVERNDDRDDDNYQLQKCYSSLLRK